MAAKALTLVRWEWFKLRKRWMPWILFIIALLFSQLAVWGPFIAYQQEKNRQTLTIFAGGPGAGREGGVTIDCKAVLAGDASGLPAGTDPVALAAYQENCRRFEGQRATALEQMKRTFTLPVSIAQALAIAEGFGVILVAIMTASNIGSEYGWGTLRTVLVRGTGRWTYLASKLVVIATGGLLLMVAVALAAIVSSLITGSLAGFDQSISGIKFVGDMALDIGRAWFALWPFIALATLFSLAARSAAAGMAGAIGYYFGEAIATGILSGLFEWFQGVSDYFIVRNTSAWMQGLRLSEGEAGRVVVMNFGFGNFPSELHAFLVLAGYVLVMGGVAFWLFQRRDVTSGGGG
ncbi:MAG: ABC transporter permease subunit [Chloroflexi bacterium]|nr:ABC transporter permease subunit [Chloroflexota bacterium]